MKRIAGYAIIMAVFGGLIAWTAAMIGWYSLLLSWATALGIAGLLMLAVVWIEGN